MANESVCFGDIEITGEYTPGRPAVMYDKNGTGEPPEPAEFEPDEMYYDDGDKIYDITDIFDELCNEQLINVEVLKDRCIEKIQEWAE